MPEPVRVLIVDDSALVRKMLSDLLNSNSRIEVVGTAQDGSFVHNKIKQFNPDVITLDVEMRTKGGLEVLPEIVEQYNLPVIMVSSHTEKGAKSTMRALELGAVDFVTKPHAFGDRIEEIVDELSRKIIAVGRQRSPKTLQKHGAPAVRTTPAKPAVAKPLPSVQPAHMDLIAIGASTGGTEAIKEVLTQLPDNLPGIVVVQHMPPGFTKAFSERLNTLSRIHVKEAEDGDPVQPGTALIAPGNYHLEVVRSGIGKYSAKVTQTPPVNRHRPSVDVLYHSVATNVGARVEAIILTGMGGDGSTGLKALYDKGALTIAQNEGTCVVFGMPREAIKLGGAKHILPLDQIASFMVASILPVRKTHHSVN